MKKCLAVAVFSIVFELGMPHMSLAAHENWSALSNGNQMPYKNSFFGSYPSIDSFTMVVSRNEKLVSKESAKGGRFSTLPIDDAPSVVKEHWLTVTAYSSHSSQTDDTPYTTAWQTPVRDGVVALNFLPKGTFVKFPDLFGDKIFVVEDRMNVRYPYRADIWMRTSKQARQFGIKYVRMQELGVRVPRDYVLGHFDGAFPAKK